MMQLLSCWLMGGWKSRKRFVWICGISTLVIWAGMACSAHASVYNKLYVFGDSLSDVGNNPTSSPYWSGRSSNGPVWCEQLAELLGLSAITASSKGGTDYAVAGAKISGVASQITSYLNSVGNVADSNSLYAVWAGANNFFGTLGSSPSLSKLNYCSSMLSSWVSTLAESIRDLVEAGATDILVLNLPALGDTPYYSWSAYRSDINSLVDTFNDLLSDALAELESEYSNLNITLVDANALLEDECANPSKYGLTNVTNPAIYYSPSDASGYLYWDYVHPTTESHGIVAALAYEELMQAASVPEPNTMILWALGSVVSLASMRLRRRTARPLL